MLEAFTGTRSKAGLIVKHINPTTGQDLHIPSILQIIHGHGNADKSLWRNIKVDTWQLLFPPQHNKPQEMLAVAEESTVERSITQRESLVKRSKGGLIENIWIQTVED